MIKKSNGVVKAKAMVALSKMPPLSHWPERTQKFTILESEVVRWMLQQPDVLAWMFEKSRALGVLEFNEETKLWSGKEL